MATQEVKITGPGENPESTTVRVPILYFNGFVNNLGAADISTLLMLDSVPVGRIHMSFTTAKTFASLLNELVLTLESVTQHNIMLTTEVDKGLKEHGSKGKEK